MTPPIWLDAAGRRRPTRLLDLWPRGRPDAVPSGRPLDCIVVDTFLYLRGALRRVRQAKGLSQTALARKPRLSRV